MNMVRKPDSQRGPQLARRAKATAAGILVFGRRAVPVVLVEPVSTSSPSPRLASTFSGRRIAQIVASTKTTNP